MRNVPRFISARKTLMAASCAALIAFSPLLSRAQDDPPTEAGRISFVQGAASVQPVGLDEWGRAEVNMPLGPGDRIFTDEDSRAEIQIGRTYLRLGPGTDVSIVDVAPWAVSIGVAQGHVHVHCYGLWPNQRLHINTPSGSETLDTPGEFRVDVYPDQQAALFTEYVTIAYLSGAGGFRSDLPAGSALELVGSNPVIPQWMEPAQPESIDFWSQQRDQQIANSISYRYVSSDIGGAWELDANGDWYPQSPYGPIWFPRVGPGWAPYHYGHWVSHAPWGWVWVEEESWGYTPFHYGRWVVFNGRWGWVPGPPAAHPVWSPALVVFAGGIHVGGGGVSAWFPLGPGEPYRPWYPCSPHYVDQVNITNLTPTPTVHVAVSYAGFNFNAAVFANRTAGISAMRQEDFAAGRPVRETNVVINKTVINNITIINQPEVAPNPHVFASHPPSRPVPVPAARPALINEQGMVVSAKVGSKPAPPPVRPAPQVQVLPGHKVVAPPQGVSTTARPNNAAGAPEKPAQQQPTKVTPAGKPAVSGTSAPNQGGQGPHPSSARPSELTAKPASNPPAQPAPKAETEPGAKPTANPQAQPATTKPAQNPNQKPGAKPADKSKEGDKEAPKKEKPEDNNN